MKYLKFFPFYILSILPLSFLYLISDVAFFVVFYIIKYRKDVVRYNLKKSFPDKTKSERVKIEKEFYKHFCDIAFETVKVLTISPKALSKRFRIKNKEFIDELFRQEKNVIMYAAHYGNWEWMCFLPILIPYHIQSFYQKLSNKYFDDFMLNLRKRFGATCIESSKGYRTMVKSRQNKELTLTCMIGDQCPHREAAKHWVNFLNQETAFLQGTERIAKKLKQTVIYISFQEIKRGKYEIEFLPIEDVPACCNGEEIIDKYAEVLEHSIKKRPELWLWSHRRWKLTRNIA